MYKIYHSHISAILFVTAYFLLSTLTIIAKDNLEKGTDKIQDPAELSAYIKYETATIIREKPLIMALEHVSAYLADRTINADYLIGWHDEEAKSSEGKKFPFDEIYCEGNIEITIGKDIIRAKQVYYNLKNGQGIIKNVEWRTVWIDEKGNVPKEAIPLLIRADEIIQVNNTTFEAYHASVTTCPHGAPHYDLWAGTVVFTKDEYGKRISLYNLIPRISGIPVFYFPYYYKVIGNDPLIRSIGIKNTKIFGFTTQVTCGININKLKRDDNGELVKGKDGLYIPKRWGDFTLENDFYKKRGTGWGPELKYQWDNYEGKLMGYYIHDKGPDPDIDYNRQFLPMEKDDRGRLKFFNRYNNFLIKGVKFDTEVSHISDRHFLLEYFQKEALEGKEQETYAYWRWQEENKAVTLIERFRLNDFQTQTEYSPQISTKLFKESFNLFIPLYFSSFTELSNVRKRFDVDLLTPDMPRLVRFDTLEEVSSPFHVSFLSFSPYVSGRFTSYEKDPLEGNYTDRFVGSGGIRLFTQFHRIFDTQLPSLGIDKFRHAISFDIRYNTVLALTREPSELIEYDTIDQLDRFKEYYFEIRNRFQTKSGKTYFEFMNIGVAAEYYPKAMRDTAKENPANYLYPMNWITLAPVNPAAPISVFPERRLSNINADLNFTPKSIFSFAITHEYNTYEKRSEVFNTVVNIIPYPGWSIDLSERYLRELADMAGLAVRFSPIEKWWLTVSEQYNFQANRFANTSYALRRDLHELFIEFSITRDYITGDKLIGFMITPKGIVERGVSFISSK